MESHLLLADFGLCRGGRFKRKHVEAFFVPPGGYHLKQFLRALTTYAFREQLKSWLHWKEPSA